jgi:defect in organelle trafficking protein DotD
MNMKPTSIVTLFFAIAISLAACTTAAVNTNDTHSTEVALSEASYTVGRSIAHLSEVAQASHPLPAMDPPPNPNTYGMGALVSLDWSGPVEPLVQQIANASNYRMRVLGTAPAIPVLVTIYAKNSVLADVLRDVGYQCGRRANVLIFPDSRVIELRYAKN